MVKMYLYTHSDVFWRQWTQWVEFQVCRKWWKLEPSSCLPMLFLVMFAIWLFSSGPFRSMGWTFYKGLLNPRWQPVFQHLSFMRQSVPCLTWFAHTHMQTQLLFRPLCESLVTFWFHYIRSAFDYVNMVSTLCTFWKFIVYFLFYF